MQTDYAQILPIILPVPKVGPSAPANVASADGKTASPTGAEATDLDAIASEAGSDDLSQAPSAFDQALAQMMMVQVPVQAAKPAPQAPLQQGLSTNPTDITAALDALQAGSGLGLASSGNDARSNLPAPLVAAPAPTDLLPDPNLQAAAQTDSAPQTLPADLAIAIGAAAPSAPLATQTANFAEPRPVAEGLRSDGGAQTLPIVSATSELNVASAANAPQVQSKPIDLALSTPIASPDSTLAKAATDRAPQTSILQAMGNAAADATARVTGISVTQPLSIPNQAAPNAPEFDPAQTAPSALVQSQSAAPAQLNAQAMSAAATQASTSAQPGSRQSAQANSRATLQPLVSSEAATTSTAPIANPLTAISIATNGGASSADTGGAFEDSPADLAQTAAAEAAQSDSEASTDIFGAPLPLEGRVTQASLQAGSSATLSTPATAPHLAAEISRKFEGKSAQFDISLTPEGLGKVDVKITINARGEVSAAMKFDNPQAAAELKGRAAELQRALEQSGFSLSQDGISFSDGQGQGFNAPQQQASQQDWQETARRTAQNRLFQDSNDLADAAALRVAEASSAYSRRSSTGIDVRI